MVWGVFMFIISKPKVVRQVIITALIMILVIVCVAQIPATEREIARRHLIKQGQTPEEYPAQTLQTSEGRWYTFKTDIGEISVLVKGRKVIVTKM